MQDVRCPECRSRAVAAGADRWECPEPQCRVLAFGLGSLRPTAPAPVTGVTYTCEGCGRETVARGRLAETAPPTFTAHCRDCARSSLYIRRPVKTPETAPYWPESPAELERWRFARWLYLRGRVREFDLSGTAPDPLQA